MADIWVISDTHFGHDNIIKFCNRPFSDIYDMNETMVERWNSRVKPGDKVYHLGDVYFGSSQYAWDTLKRLNGKKRLVLGNHDNALGQIERNFFQKVVVWRRFDDLGLLLTHVPVHPSTLRENRFKKQMVNVHGHIHTNPSPEGPYRCVCVEQTDYFPVHIEELKG